ncbi:unnamed protein product [Parnassius mnemosyne]|uniref:Uncharacterized protein n=1 Tax=Parnassius mnemosyne TaxID=213953 RepID=A0AAV1M5F8_9NEOP
MIYYFTFVKIHNSLYVYISAEAEIVRNLIFHPHDTIFYPLFSLSVTGQQRARTYARSGVCDIPHYVTVYCCTKLRLVANCKVINSPCHFQFLNKLQLPIKTKKCCEILHVS